jgi:NADH-quinone oxidoreductase E subunit
MVKLNVEIIDVANEYKNSKNEHYKAKMADAENFDYKWNAKQKSDIKNLLSKYPKEQKQSALLPLLTFAQDEFDGWLPVRLMQLVADTLELPLMKVQEVATFYTMYNLKPVGKYHLQVCTNCACVVNGVGKVLDAVKLEVGDIEDGISKDGLFTISEVECLGACIESPLIQVNKDYRTKLTAQSAVDLIKELKVKG